MPSDPTELAWTLLQADRRRKAAKTKHAPTEQVMVN